MQNEAPSPPSACISAEGALASLANLKIKKRKTAGKIRHSLSASGMQALDALPSASSDPVYYI